MRCFTKDQVAISGDATQGSTPRQGAAIGQAVEDAYVLCSLLGDGSGPITRRRARALEAPCCNSVATSAENDQDQSKAGEVYAFAGPAGSELGKIRFDLLNRYRWIWEEDLDNEIKQARALLRYIQRNVLLLRDPIKQGIFLSSAVHRQGNGPGETFGRQSLRGLGQQCRGEIYASTHQRQRHS